MSSSNWWQSTAGLWRSSGNPGFTNECGSHNLNIRQRLSFLRTLLLLGRVSNLPTVWSNCLAGWWLGGGGNFEKLPYLFAATTVLYIGGMFLNDAFDAEFDRVYRKERPIPSGKTSLEAVWRWGLAWLGI